MVALNVVERLVIPSGSEESVVGAQFIAPRNQGVINHAPTEERFLALLEMTEVCGRNVCLSFPPEFTLVETGAGMTEEIYRCNSFHLEIN
ncbi:MAG: hypothetical protein ABII25_02625 [bacterium]